VQVVVVVTQELAPDGGRSGGNGGAGGFGGGGGGGGGGGRDDDDELFSEAPQSMVTEDQGVKLENLEAMAGVMAEKFKMAVKVAGVLV
jgi:hypothetical protein